MLGSIPGNIIKLDRLLVVLVAVTAEFKSLERRLATNPVGNNMVQGPGLRIRRMFQTEGTGTGKKTGGTLGMYIRTRLESTIQPRNQSNLILELLQGLHGWSQLQVIQANSNVRSGTFGIKIIIGKLLLYRTLFLTRKESLPNHPDRHIIKSRPLGNLKMLTTHRQAFHPWQGKGGGSHSAKKSTAANICHRFHIFKIYLGLCKASLPLGPRKGFDCTTA